MGDEAAVEAAFAKTAAELGEPVIVFGERRHCAPRGRRRPRTHHPAGTR